jgi:hypothetical protein
MPAPWVGRGARDGTDDQLTVHLRSWYAQLRLKRRPHAERSGRLSGPRHVALQGMGYRGLQDCERTRCRGWNRARGR